MSQVVKRKVGRPKTAIWITPALSRRIKERLYEQRRRHIALARDVSIPINSLRSWLNGNGGLSQKRVDAILDNMGLCE